MCWCAVKKLLTHSPSSPHADFPVVGPGSVDPDVSLARIPEVTALSHCTSTSSQLSDWSAMAQLNSAVEYETKRKNKMKQMQKHSLD